MKLHLAAFLALAVVAHAAPTGIRLTDHDARASARGGAWTATADTPAAIYYNPAGISQLDGFQTRLGFYSITVDSEFRSPTGVFAENDDRWVVTPDLFASYRIPSSDFTLGFGAYVPYGLTISYERTAPFATVEHGSRIGYFSANPVIAWKPLKQLSIAVGLTVNYAEAAQRRVLNLGFPEINGEAKLEGSGYDVGLNAGILWQPTPQHSFGVQYRSATHVRLAGHASFNTDRGTALVDTPAGPMPVEIPSQRGEFDADATFIFPQYVIFGYSFRPTPDWNFEANVDWTDWNQLNKFHVHQFDGSVRSESTLAFDWENALAFQFGVTRELPRGFHVSAGYAYTQHTVPEFRFMPDVPDGRRHIYTAGLGQEWKRFTWDVAYQYFYQPSRTISNGTPADGDWRLRAHAVTLSLGYHF